MRDLGRLFSFLIVFNFWNDTLALVPVPTLVVPSP